ncbi:hypothetical protein DXG01_006299 [Tephrocybe rancida]|nr:hypothetical protein DXG01_006299 [Tephrocybe rancida]
MVTLGRRRRRKYYFLLAMQAEEQQLVEMGAMQAAERTFEGAFDNVNDGDDVLMASSSGEAKRARPATPEDEDMGSDDAQDEDEEDDEFLDYDSDYEEKSNGNQIVADVDPYSGMNLPLLTGLFWLSWPLSQAFYFQRIGKKK